MAVGDVVLGANQYGKAEVRLVRVTRDTPVHEIEDLTVTTQLRGDFEACHTTGDNAHVVATDTQKNTVYAFAKRFGVGSPERFLLRLGRHFVDGFEQVTGGRLAADVHAWDRIAVDGEPHDHAFVRTGRETRRAVVQLDGDDVHVISGFTGATVLKSTGSEFWGFPRDAHTTLAETKDRVLATSVTAWWRWADADVDFEARYPVVRDLLLSTFAQVHSLALQHTIFAMGRAVLEACDDVAEVRLSCPNKHHFLVDLEPFGLENPNEVFYAADRPYGLIEAAVHREGDPPVPHVWASVPGFV
ncbi:factor-independent urate hydroxylase [Cellulomonas xiejunii]|uniref:Uricase n=1 Tax=Cellulomonas xiejunii TaxID=2968083 RepID=A0ABY5KP19_9CELL|nr:urate oxidase [Cellulomonas xiejunii]MCC2320621.1 urate oxidase [Cellulomonas xiejunii]UUI70911.1 urate oxidase [Cellulomonas xiejunii]